MELYHSQFTADEFERAIHSMLTYAVEEKDVNFWDYDGTLLYSYTLEEARALTELPPGPDWHGELVFDGWNWPLEEINELTYQVDVGALYETDDLAAHLHIELRRAEEVSVVVGGTGYIDWGDGSPRTELISVPASTVATHVYANPGTYIIRVGAENRTISLGYKDGSKNCLNGNKNILRKAFPGEFCELCNYVFKDCRLLEYTTCSGKRGVPTGAYSNASNLVCAHIQTGSLLSPYSFDMCRSLRMLTARTESAAACCMRGCSSLRRFRGVPSMSLIETYTFSSASALQEARTALNLGNKYAFASCGSMAKFVMAPESTGLGTNCFQACSILEELEITKLVTTIAANAMLDCGGMRRLRFHPAAPPTVPNANAFSGIPSTCIVEVPAASLEAYKNATNYASLAAQMVGV